MVENIIFNCYELSNKEIEFINKYVNAKVNPNQDRYEYYELDDDVYRYHDFDFDYENLVDNYNLKEYTLIESLDDFKIAIGEKNNTYELW